MGIFDAIWKKRGRQNKATIENMKEQAAYTITQTNRDYSNILEDGDVAIKFWLPELMNSVLNEMCTYLDTSRSDLVRQTLFTYLYGRYDLIGLVERKSHYYQLDKVHEVRFSRTSLKKNNPLYQEPNIMQDMGKNTEDLKIWIPNQMKNDIQKIADKASIPLSAMLREILISTLFGHTYLSARQDLLQIEIEIFKGQK